MTQKCKTNVKICPLQTHLSVTSRLPLIYHRTKRRNRCTQSFNHDKTLNVNTVLQSALLGKKPKRTQLCNMSAMAVVYLRMQPLVTTAQSKRSALRGVRAQTATMQLRAQVPLWKFRILIWHTAQVPGARRLSALQRSAFRRSAHGARLPARPYLRSALGYAARAALLHEIKNVK